MATAMDLMPPVSFEIFLAETKRVSLGSIERAKRLSEETADRLGATILKLGILSEQELADAYVAFAGLRRIQLAEFPEKAILDGIISAKFLRQSNVIPVAEDSERIVLAIADPLDDGTVRAIEYATERAVELRVALPSDIAKAFESLYGDGTTKTEQIVANFDVHTVSSEDTADAERLKDLASDAPIIQLVNFWIDRAVEAGASDIHIEPAENMVNVRFRLDGELKEIEQTPIRLAPAIGSRIKVMARLDISERRLPQDGKLRIPVRGRDIDFRVSIIPTVHGESIVLRILDRSQVKLDFQALGYNSDVLERYRAELRRPHGILLVTGPTGSGKTTTLYASLAEIRSSTRKILTIEDPVEYQLDGINQTQVHPQIGLTFASSLRAFLRHDPDVILVGEIRDSETAHIAVQAALTGHLVLSTLHTNDAAGAVTRLIDMGVESYLIAAAVNGIAAQRLVRKLCPDCRQSYVPSEELRRSIRLPDSVAPGIRLFRPVGCPRCNHTGYSGRVAIIEFLTMSDRLRDLIVRNAPVGELREASQSEGLETMYQYGLRKCITGLTSVEEVMKATGDF